MRLPDWPERLIEFIEARRARAFSWGSNDCALFYADAVLAMTGEDRAKPWRGYKTARGAAARITKAGGLRALVESAGVTEKPVGFAQRGDGVLALLNDRETFGVVVGDGNWCGPGEFGLVFRPMSEAIAVFTD